VTDKKSTGKSAGSTRQWRQLGGGKRPESQESEPLDSEPSKSQSIQPSERPDVQLSEHSTIQDAKQLDSEASKRLEVEPSSHQTIQPSESLDKGESSMPNSTAVEHPSTQKSRGNKQQRDKLTIYLEPELNDWVRQQVIIEKRRRGHHVEISDIINEALRKAKENS
jgi:hypothetical protein